MANLSQNYRLRKCYLEQNQVPTQTVIKQKMTPALANIYFKSMTPKTKVLAGLEPPLKGGGPDWYVPPEELLKGRIVLKPFKKKYLSKLTCEGLDEMSLNLVENYRHSLKAQRRIVMRQCDEAGRKRVEILRHEMYKECCDAEAQNNTEYLQRACREVSALYRTFTTQFQDLFFNAAEKSIKKYQNEILQKMQSRLQSLLQQQAAMLNDRYTKKLMEEKAKLKSEFIFNLEVCRTELGHKLHDINFEKHVAIAKSRKLLECRNLACQVYVALKERQECTTIIEKAKREQEIKFKSLGIDIVCKDIEIYRAERKERARFRFEDLWKSKVCHVVKMFQLFVSYCLNLLPEYADFFINMEKLMMLQLNDALEDPQSESIFEKYVEQFHPPIPEPHPFYLFCDKGYKPKVDRNLCPERCTSSASQFPVVVVNKRCIYSACDNFQQFTNNVKEFIQGERGEDRDLEDKYDYNSSVPVKYTPSQQLLELKLESSLLQVLQQEIENLRDVPIMCQGCKLPHCFDCHSPTTVPSDIISNESIEMVSLPSFPSSDKPLTQTAELKYQREPKWESYMEYVETKKCHCAKMVKKHLLEHLPPYMRIISNYDAPELLNYEPCSVAALKSLVKKAKGKKPPSLPSLKVPSKTKEMSTQISDREFDFLCTCFSDEEINNFLMALRLQGTNMTPPGPYRQFRVVGGSMSATYLTQDSKSFANDRAMSLRRLIDRSPEVKELFKRKDCVF